jgi:hypothetical protein
MKLALLPKRFSKQSSTFRRLLASQHVRDLRLIFATAVAVMLYVVVWHGIVAWDFWPFSYLRDLVSADPQHQDWERKFVGAVLLAGGWVLAWTYQTGSKRLGVVDLFACEIVTLCRVGTIVDLVPKLIAAHEKLFSSAPADTPGGHQQDISLGRFTSQENYFPVFEGNNKDLQILEADVVINVTAFYTYMKALRDQFRRLGDLGVGTELNQQKSAVLINAIYMAFLAYESARKSLVELIEYEPTQAEAMVTGLVSELSAYRFLTRWFDSETDIRGRRLALRAKEYRELVPKLCHELGSSTGADWENARTTAIDLELLYNSMNFLPKIRRMGDPTVAADLGPELQKSAVSIETPVTLVSPNPALRYGATADDSAACALRAESLEANIAARSMS